MIHLVRPPHKIQYVANMHACLLGRLSHVQLLLTPQTVACQALLSMGFSKQEQWSGLSFLPPESLAHTMD